MQLAGPLFFFNPVKTVREGKHIIILRTGRTIHPGIQIGHGIVHLTAVTEDIVGPEYQFGLFLFTEFLTQFKVQTIIRPAGHCPCFVPIISIKIVSSHKKTFPEKPPAIGHYHLFEILSFTGG